MRSALRSAGHYLWHAKNLRVPGGLLVAVAVSMAPLAVYGIQDALGWWGQFGKPGTVHDFYVWIKGSWVFMEIATVVAGAVALRFYPFPFIVALIAVALWFMSMDLAPWIASVRSSRFGDAAQVSVWFGLAVLAVAWTVDYRSRDGDFAFWLHLFGLLAFWGGVSRLRWRRPNWGRRSTACSTSACCSMAVILARRAYAVFGTLGVPLYLGHLADKVFKDSLLFPFSLSLIGIAVIAAGLFYHRKERTIAAWLSAHLPATLLRLRPV